MLIAVLILEKIMLYLCIYMCFIRMCMFVYMRVYACAVCLWVGACMCLFIILCSYICAFVVNIGLILGY